MSFVSNTERYRPGITPSPGRLSRKVALITGAGRGIGQAVAARFAQEGAAIAVTDRDEDAAIDAARRLRESGAMAQSWRMDVTDRARVETVIDEAADAFGGLDLLVNNAGIIVFGSLMECNPQDWDTMMAVDLTGAMHCTQLAARRMIRQGRGGRLIHVGSTASLLPTAEQAAYCVAKAGLRMLSRMAALELVKHGITSNLLCPEGAVTDINRELLSDPAVMNKLEAMIPAGRMATVEEIAALAAFIASDEAAYMTGAELVHDGGATIGALWWR